MLLDAHSWQTVFSLKKLNVKKSQHLKEQEGNSLKHSTSAH